MTEIMSDDIQKFNYSPQDIAELYCVVCEKEDLINRKKEKSCGDEVALYLKLNTLDVMKNHLVKIYSIFVSDLDVMAVLEHCYCIYKWNKNRQSTVTIKDIDFYKQKNSFPEDQDTVLLTGIKKDEKLLAIYQKLSKEGVWKGKLKKSVVSEDDMKRFFFVLCMDVYWFTLLQHNASVEINCKERLNALIEDLSLLKEYFLFNFNINPESEYEKWRQTINSVLKNDVDFLEKSIKDSTQKEEILFAYGVFDNFWSTLLACVNSKNWINMTSMIGIGIEPVGKMQILKLLPLLGQKDNKAKDEFLSIIQKSNAEIIGLEAEHFLCLRNELEKIKQIKRIVVLTRNNKNSVFVWSCE